VPSVSDIAGPTTGIRLHPKITPLPINFAQSAPDLSLYANSVAVAAIPIIATP
jgi:hypothetical protein